MRIDEKYIDEYMRIYEKDKGKSVSRMQAMVELRALVELMSAVNHYLCQHPEEANAIRTVLIGKE